MANINQVIPNISDISGVLKRISAETEDRKHQQELKVAVADLELVDEAIKLVCKRYDQLEERLLKVAAGVEQVVARKTAETEPEKVDGLG